MLHSSIKQSLIWHIFVSARISRWFAILVYHKRCVCVCVRACVRACVRGCVRACVRACMRVRAYVYGGAYVCLCFHECVHSYASQKHHLYLFIVTQRSLRNAYNGTLSIILGWIIANNGGRILNVVWHRLRRDRYFTPLDGDTRGEFASPSSRARGSCGWLRGYQFSLPLAHPYQ